LKVKVNLSLFFGNNISETLLENQINMFQTSPVVTTATHPWWTLNGALKLMNLSSASPIFQFQRKPRS